MSDELMHPTQDDPAWSESYYFNFVDPNSTLGMFTRMGFRPGSGWADALHAIYLPGRRVIFTYGRRDIGTDLTAYDGDLSAGDLKLTCIEPHKRWRIAYRGPAQDIADGRVLLQRSRSRPEGWFRPSILDMDVEFECLTDPHYAASGARGHFEQSGRIQGRIRLGDEHWAVDGYGVRDKSWGPRDWGAGEREQTPAAGTGTGPAPFVNWFSMNFDTHAALGGSCFRSRDGVMRGEGWLQRDGTSGTLRNVVIETDYEADSILHRSIRLRARLDSGEHIEITGEVLNLCPTKIPMPGGATFVNEGLTRFQWGERTGYGIAEHWHAVSL